MTWRYEWGVQAYVESDDKQILAMLCVLNSNDRIDWFRDKDIMWTKTEGHWIVFGYYVGIPWLNFDLPLDTYTHKDGELVVKGSLSIPALSFEAPLPREQEFRWREI